MPTYLAFLRAINLGANRVFPKADIRRTVEALGFADVSTHINTGNVRFTTRMRSRERIERTLEGAFAADRGFDVPTIVYPAAEFARIAEEGGHLHESHPGLARHYVYLLKDPLSSEQLRQVEQTAQPAGCMVVRDRAAHALLGPGYSSGTVDPLGAARHLGVATARTLAVVRTLAQRWC